MTNEIFERLDAHAHRILAIVLIVGIGTRVQVFAHVNHIRRVRAVVGLLCLAQVVWHRALVG